MTTTHEFRDAIGRRQVRIGSHLISDRTILNGTITVYQHHGIYIGNRKVVHHKGFSEFLKKEDIGEDSIENFASDQQNITIRDYALPINKEEIFARINIMKSKNPAYSLISSNCEHFATYCRTGKFDSDQVYRTTRYGIIGQIILLNI